MIKRLFDWEADFYQEAAQRRPPVRICAGGGGTFPDIHFDALHIDLSVTRGYYLKSCLLSNNSRDFLFVIV